jgi:hypothetical protein
LFVEVGKTLDRLRGMRVRQKSRWDKPVLEAVKKVAKKWSVNEATVQKAWSYYGAEAGWDTERSTWADE